MLLLAEKIPLFPVNDIVPFERVFTAVGMNEVSLYVIVA